jgi:branched-chain amino acid transport system substrate-binding protein
MTAFAIRMRLVPGRIADYAGRDSGFIWTMEVESTMRVVGLMAPVLLLALLLPGCWTNGRDPVTIGALLPMTGALASYGQTSNAALIQAVTAINRAKPRSVELRIEDTKTEPAVGLEKLQALKAEGIRIVIGPYSSAEVSQVKAYADQNGMILLSPLSTAQSLAVANDNVLRFTPDDKQEAIAVAALAWTDGIRTIVPITRDDEGNKGLQMALKAAFEALGGAVLTPIVYSTSETDFQDEVRALEANISGRPGPQTAVYLTAFAEVTRVLTQAATSEALGGLRWYGSDGVALSRELVADRAAATFAVKVGYPNPILGLSANDRDAWEPVAEAVAQKLGRTPDAFALAAYDAMQVAHLALLDAGKDADVQTLRQAIVTTANAHRGLTGSTRLNDAGDRVSGNYDFWAVCPASGGAFQWIRTATYTVGADGRGVAARPRGC